MCLCVFVVPSENVKMDPFSILWLIPVVPLLGAGINGILGKRLPKNIITAVGVGTVAVSFIIALREFLAMLRTSALPINRDYFT